MNIIDTHAHLAGIDPFYLRQSEELNVVGSYVSCVGMDQESFTFHPEPPLCRAYNDQIKELMDTHKNLIRGMCYVNPIYLAESLQEIDRCLKMNFSGIKLWVSLKADHPNVSKIAQYAQKKGVPVLQHCWLKATGNLEFESSPDEIAWLAKRNPETVIIMPHAGGDWEYGLKTIRRYKNVLADIAMSLMDNGLVELAVEVLGDERVLWGTDAPVSSVAAAAGKVFDADISDISKERILYSNAVRVYRL